MTNGEKIQQMFPRKCPHIGFNENFGRIWLMQDGEDFANFTLKWWNAEYKEPTTKNDLVVDCISRADAIRVASGYCHPSNVAKELAKLPSMGRYDPYTDKFIKE